MAQLDASTTTSASVAQHLSDHNRLHAKANYVFDVTDYGATGDGSTDDITAINNTVTAAGRGTVFFPPGTYNISESITGGSSGVIFAGVGEASVINNTNAAGDHAFTAPAAIRGYSIRDLRITGNGSDGDGIHLTANYGGVQITNVEITDVGGSGVDGSEGTGIQVYLRHVRVDRAGGSSFNFNQFGATALNTLTAVNCYGNASGSDSWVIANVGNGSFIGCAADNATGRGWQISGAGLTFIGCSAEANSSYGFDSLSSTGRVTMIGCKTYNNPTPFRITSTGNTTLINPITVSSTGASLTVTSTATGQNLLINPAFDSTISLNASANLTKLSSSILTMDDGPTIQTGSGSPESSVTAVVGSLYMRTDGGTNTTLYVKESGTGNTGWAAI